MSTSFTPLAFTGISPYSSDFQTILNRAVTIAQLPVKQLQNRDSDTLQKKTLLSTLASQVNRLVSDLRSLGDVAAGQALSASTSDPTIVTAANTGAATPASYTIDSITSAASPASERTLVSYADSSDTPVSSTGTVKLIAGSSSYTLSLSTNNLLSLRDQINNLNAGVNASILTTPSGNYLALNANTTGATTLRLIDDPDGAAADLLTAANQGSNAVFKLNGIDVSQPGNIVNNVIPGVTLTILKASNSPVTVSLASDRSRLSAAVQTFVSSFNAARDTVNAQIGPAAGLLSGDTVITQVADQLRQIAAFQTPSGSVRTLADLGVTFDSSGHASFDSSVFNALPDTSISDAFRFIGSASTGLGGFSATLQQIGDPAGGLIQIEQQGLDRTDQNLQRQIADLNDRIAVMRNALAAKLQAADSLLGLLAAQQQQIAASLQGLNLVLYGRNTNQG
jgi:flagellar hook-associated protein 2